MKSDINLKNRNNRSFISADKQLLAVYKINKFLGSIHNLEKLLTSIMSEASKTVKAEASSIALYEDRTKNLQFAVALGEKGHKLKKMYIKLGDGIIGTAAKQRRPLCVSNVTKDSRFNSRIDKKIGFKSKSLLAVPLIHKNKLIGALEVINKKISNRVVPFGRDDIRILEIIAGQAAIAIENAKLYKKILEKHQDLKNKHEQLLNMQEKVIKMERLSAIGDMASKIVHDMRNALTIVIGYAELMRAKRIKPEEKNTFPKIIFDESNRLVGMTTELLDFAKGQSNMSFREHQTDVFFNEICSFLERDFSDNNIKLIIKLGYSGNVYLDKNKIQRAIFNISFNAKDAMPNGGAFKIEVNRAGHRYIEIKLSDTGCGIPEEIKDTLFETFVTKGKKHGTGLGLAIVKKVIEDHKGAISVESQRKRPDGTGTSGTVFTIKLPIKQETS